MEVTREASRSVRKSAEAAAAAGRTSSKEVSSAVKAVSKEVSAAGREVLQDVKSGQDGLGSVVKVVSKKSERVDRFFHCCNAVGFACAERHRIKLMLAAVVIGMAIFASALCGALGLGPSHMDTLPWGHYDDVMLVLGGLVWFACIGRNETQCALELLHPNNTALWTNMRRMPDPYNVTAVVRFTEMEEIARVDWKLNPWGMCLFPAGAQHEWLAPSIAAASPVGAFHHAAAAGVCRPWGQLHLPAGAEYDDHLAGCRHQQLDTFSLVMGAFGGFMKIVEPLSRLKRSTDRHQKTVVLLIIAISTLPPIIGISSFSVACVASMSDDFDEYYGKGMLFGAGAILFSLSLALMLPVAALHIILPAAETTARHAAAAQVAPE